MDPAPPARTETFLLLAPHRRGESREERLADLRSRLDAVPGFAGATLVPEGRSCVAVTVSAGDDGGAGTLQDALAAGIGGWAVIERSSYGPPGLP